ncbi:MAG: hypothetical protein M1837_002904 [Sclerophora amabilis]|nr:MAG: hypothetical protein M1837_002904 [Sclerophora amabilis]
MAWQSPSQMTGNGGPGGGGDGANSAGQPQGTEYTLQGVMRFLQTEWHRHERDRNAWEIERAEMKGRIAKLEGDSRTGKKLQESLTKHVQMLEKALKRERDKAKTGPTGEDSTSGGNTTHEMKTEALKGEAHGSANNLKPATKHHNSFLDVEMDGKFQFRDNPQKQKSQTYLDKSLQEITYLLIAPPHPPAQQQQTHMTSHDLAAVQGFNDPHHQSLEDVYLQHQREKNHIQPAIGFSQPSPLPNHQPPPVPSTPDMPNNINHMNQMQQASHMQRNLPDQQSLPAGGAVSLMDNLAQSQSQPQPLANYAPPPEELVEKVSHSYDSYGRPIPSRPEESNIGSHGISEEAGVADTDGWNFDEPTRPSHYGPDQNFQRSDTDAFPNANHVSTKSPPRTSAGSHRRKGSMSKRRSDESHELRRLSSPSQSHFRAENTSFKVRFALRGHLDVVRAVIFTGGGTPSEPEICTTGDDGVIKRWIIPASYSNFGPHGGSVGNDLDIQSYFTHRGHTGAVTSLSTCPSSQNFSTGGRALGDGWIFSGGSDATIRVWERGRVDPKATLDGHSDAIWTVCVLPTTCSTVFGGESNNFGGPDRILLASGSADGTIKIWAVSAPPQLTSPQTGSRRGVGGSRRHSVTSGSGFPSSPQPSTATSTPFHYTLVHTIDRPDISASPTCISPLSLAGDSFVVSYLDASVLIFDTRTGEEVVGMASLETYDGTPVTGVTSVVATTVGLEGSAGADISRGITEDDGVVHGATGSSGGVEGIVISGHEDRYIRFFDANSGQCTYTMLAHPAAISSLSLSPDGRELVSAGHDASLRFWSLEKRSCTQDITSHRLMRSEGVCSVVWSQDGRWVVSGGGDGIVKVFAR